MEMYKTMQISPNEIEILMGCNGVIDLRYYEIMERVGYLEEGRKYKYKLLFRTPDELQEKIRKAKSFKGLFELYKKFNFEAVERFQKEKIEKLKKEIEYYKKLI